MALAAVAASVVAASVVVAAATAAPRPVRATGPAPAAVPTFLPRSVLASGATRPSPVLRTSSTAVAASVAVVASVVVAAAGAAVWPPSRNAHPLHHPRFPHPCFAFACISFPVGLFFWTACSTSRAVVKRRL